jgi:hypothetical protein
MLTFRYVRRTSLRHAGLVTIILPTHFYRLASTFFVILLRWIFADINMLAISALGALLNTVVRQHAGTSFYRQRLAAFQTFFACAQI